jgi:hypothetical protein
MFERIFDRESSLLQNENFHIIKEIYLLHFHFYCIVSIGHINEARKDKLQDTLEEEMK